MSFLGERDNIPLARDVASYLVRWAGFNQMRKREALHTWHNAASLNGRMSLKGKKYILPRCEKDTIHEDKDGQNQNIVSPMICRNALTGLLNVGRRMWVSSMKDLPLMHGNVGKKSNATIQLEEVYQSLDIFFEKLSSEGSPCATPIIREEESGLTNRDDNPDEVALPPHMTKHRCYGQWCWERGWKTKKLNRALTIYDKVANFEVREHDDDSEIPLWPVGSEPKRIVTWSTFLKYWTEKYPHIRLHNSFK